MSRLSSKFVGGPAAAGFLVLRIVAGFAMTLHGWPKIQHPMNWMGPEGPVPGILQAAAAAAEFGGGLFWIVGLLTPLASILIAATMATAAGMAHISQGHAFVANRPGDPSWELASVYFSVAILLLLAGPGRLSLDALLWKKKTTTDGR